MRRSVVLAVWMFASPVHADETADLVEKGQELAKQGAWSQAIIAFKQADAAQPRARHACFIGLAYLRRELWAQAELYFARCHQRATAADPVPDWTAEAEGQLATKLQTENVGAVTIDVTPVDATIAISGFLPDETLGHGTYHLAPGHYTLAVRAPGFPDGTRELDVVDKTPQAVRVVLVKPTPPEPTSTTPYYLIGGGVIAGVAGIVLDVAVLQGMRDDLRHDVARYDASSTKFELVRGATITLWVGGAVLAGLGTYLATRSHRDVAVSARVDREGAAVLVGWRR
jgi:hypothetical protein